MSLLAVHNLKVHFPIRGGRGFFGPGRLVRAVDGVSVSVDAGETVGLVGESGCGKTTLGRAVVRLIEPTSGTIRFGGADLTHLRGRPLREMRQQLQMIFQDPGSALDPRMTVEQIIREPMEIHRLNGSRARQREQVGELLEKVGLSPAHAQRYPHEFSGGQRQRIGIARALALQPRLIVCDEPVSALDVSVQAQVVNLLQDLQRDQGMAFLFIAHDLAVVEHISQRIVVMYLGRIVESGASAQVCQAPAHPYTQALVSAVPTLRPEKNRKRILLEGDLPSPIDPPAGCPFHPRCPVVRDQCRTEVPPLREIAKGRWAACHFAGEPLAARVNQL